MLPYTTVMTVLCWLFATASLAQQRADEPIPEASVVIHGTVGECYTIFASDSNVVRTILFTQQDDRAGFAVEIHYLDSNGIAHIVAWSTAERGGVPLMVCGVIQKVTVKVLARGPVSAKVYNASTVAGKELTTMPFQLGGGRTQWVAATLDVPRTFIYTVQEGTTEISETGLAGQVGEMPPQQHEAGTGMMIGGKSFKLLVTAKQDAKATLIETRD